MTVVSNDRKVRIGVVGVGVMGTGHAKTIDHGHAGRIELAAVADHNPRKLEPFAARGVPAFDSAERLIESGLVDAVLVVTPHFDHVPIGVKALEAGLHVLVEKPIGVHVSHAEPLLEAARRSPELTFAVMFNQRTDPRYRELKRMIESGELGRIARVNWIITDWFRTQAYYNSGGWRATWAGEGGGVLLNQCPHNLDLWQWLFGMPSKIHAFCRMGHYHAIEVDDDVTAYMEYDSGATGVLITSTGEAPGTNRLEVVGENGRVVLEDMSLRFIRNATSSFEHCRTTPDSYAKPETTSISYEFKSTGLQHAGILQNFADAVLDGADLIAPAADGIHSIELANAMLLSTMESRTVELPLDGAVYVNRFEPLVQKSRYDPTRDRDGAPVEVDVSKSF